MTSPAPETYGIYLPPGPEDDPEAELKPTAVSEDPDALQRARKLQHGDVGVVVATSTDQDDIRAALGLPYTLEPNSAGHDLMRAQIRHERQVKELRERLESEVESEPSEKERERERREPERRPAPDAAPGPDVVRPSTPSARSQPSGGGRSGGT